MEWCAWPNDGVQKSGETLSRQCNLPTIAAAAAGAVLRCVHVSGAWSFRGYGVYITMRHNFFLLILHALHAQLHTRTHLRF